MKVSMTVEIRGKEPNQPFGLLFQLLGIVFMSFSSGPESFLILMHFLSGNDTWY